MCSIVGYNAAVNIVAAASRLTLVDADPYETLGASLPADTASTKGVIIDHKGVASVDNTLRCMFPEPIKMANGVAIMNADNLLPGKIIVYIR